VAKKRENTEAFERFARTAGARPEENTEARHVDGRSLSGIVNAAIYV
jgi:hypothetical protein